MDRKNGLSGGVSVHSPVQSLDGPVCVSRVGAENLAAVYKGPSINVPLDGRVRRSYNGRVRRSYNERECFCGATMWAECDFVIGGYTSQLQVMDVGINKPFKDNIQKCYEGWMHENTENNKVLRLDVAKWIAAAWDGITTDSIVNRWAKIGFVNYNN